MPSAAGPTNDPITTASRLLEEWVSVFDARIDAATRWNGTTAACVYTRTGFQSWARTMSALFTVAWTTSITTSDQSPQPVTAQAMPAATPSTLLTTSALARTRNLSSR